MASAPKSAPMPERIGKQGGESLGLVEIDAVFGKMLGFSDGQKVGEHISIASTLLITFRSMYCFI